MSRSSWKLTVRHGSEVRRLQYDSLDEAVAAGVQQAEAIRAEGPLRPVKAFRDYEPGDRIHARLEITAPGLWRSAAAGVDVMGDGSLIPYRGGVRRKPLAREGRSPFEAVRAALAAGG